MPKHETPEAGKTTSSGSGNGTKVRLPDLPHLFLGPSSEKSVFEQSDAEFLAYIRGLVPLEGDNLDHWTWEERRDFINWCLEESILELRGDRLLPMIGVNREPSEPSPQDE